MPTAHVNGIDIYFEHSGEGRRLLFFNGSGATLETTGPLIDPFRARFEVLVHDQRGLGRSQIPPGPYSMKDYATDAIGLLDFVGWTSCRVVGVSFGGMVAQEFTVTNPGRVERLVLVCTSPGGVGARRIRCTSFVRSMTPQQVSDSYPSSTLASLRNTLPSIQPTKPWHR